MTLVLVFSYKAFILVFLFRVAGRPDWRISGVAAETLLVLLGFSPPGQGMAGFLLGFRRPHPVEHLVLDQDLTRLARRMAMPGPLLRYGVRRPGVNAFVLGSRHLAVTTGYFDVPPQGRQTVLAHELEHVTSRHALFSLAVTAFSTVANWLRYGAAVLVSGLLVVSDLRRRAGRGGPTWFTRFWRLC